MKLFISYRRKSWPSVHLLEEKLGKQIIGSIFIDYKSIDETDFERSIIHHLRDSDIVLVVVTEDTFAPNRIHNDDDWVRREIALALEIKKPIIPILIDNYPLPSSSSLPENIRDITKMQAIEFYPAYFDAAVQRLVAFITKVVPFTPESIEKRNEVSASRAVWNIPHRHNPFFIGREEILEQLHDKFKVLDAANTAQPQILIGLGGIGKTQIAIEYAYRYHEEYSSVFWLRAETRDTLTTDILTLADLLSLSQESEQDQNFVILTFKRWLSMHDDWLLILDNADDLQMVYDFLPTEGKGCVLLTSRAQSVATIGHRIEVKKMNKEEGSLLLLRRARLLTESEALDKVSEEDIAEAQAIVEAVDGLPLAIDQAGAYIEETQCRLSEYRNRYSTRRGDLLRRRGTFPNNHPESVATTLSLSFQNVEQANPAAADLLRLFAFLSPDDIPEELIKDGSQGLNASLQGIATDPYELDEAVALLRRYSLIYRNPDTQTFTIHRLVQIVIKDMMDKEAQHQWAEQVVRVVSYAFPEAPSKVVYRERCKRLLSQSRECLTLIEQWNMMFPEAALLLHLTARYLRRRAKQFAESIVFDQRALVIQEQVLGVGHSDVAGTLYGLAMSYSGLDNYEQSEAFFKQSLAISEQALGPQHLLTLRIRGDFGYLYYKQGKYKEAESLTRQTLESRLQVLGLEKLGTSTSFNILALVYSAQGKYEEAEELFNRALAIREKVSGEQSLNVAITLNNLGNLYAKQGKYDQAEPFFQRALTIREQELGMEDRATARSLKDLADLYKAQGKFEKAEPLYQQALSIWEKVLGLEYLEAAGILENYADLLRKMNREEEAALLETRAIEIRNKVGS